MFHRSFTRPNRGGFFSLSRPLRPTQGAPVAPVIGSARVDNAAPTLLVLTYSKALDASSVPLPAAFTTSPAKTISNVAVSGNTVTLTVSAAFTSADTITVSYTPGAAPIRDSGGLTAAALTNFAVTNNVLPVDSTAPTYVSAVVNAANPNRIVVTFNEALSATLTGSATVGGPSRTVTGAVVVGSTVEVTVSAPYVNGDAPTISYPAGWARDAAGNQVVIGTNRAVTNNIPDTTAPTRTSATVANATPTKIVVAFNEALSATLTGSATVGGPSRTVTGAVVVGSTVEVTVNAAYAFGDAPTITYPAGWARDAAGNQVAAASAVAVTNNVLDTTAPTFTSASIANATPDKIVAVFSETLSGTLTGSATVGGPSRTVTGAVVVGNTVEITVSAPYANGDVPTLSYPAGWVRDASSNTVAAGSGLAITNNVLASGAGRYDALYPGGWTANFATGAVSQASFAKPAKSSNISSGGYTDAVFGTLVRRTTANADVPDVANEQFRHEYSRRQAYNCDGTLKLVQSTKGNWWVQNCDTLAYLNGGQTAPTGLGAQLGMTGDCEPIWHPTDPQKLWHTAQNGGLIWYERNVITNTTTTLFDMTPHMAALGGTFTNVNACWFNGEGRPSNDGRWWGFACENVVGSVFTSRGFCMYDRQTNTVVWSLANPAGDRPNWTGTSALGNYVICSWYSVSANSLAEVEGINLATGFNPTTGTTTGMRGVMQYNRVTGVGAALSVHGEHSDVGLDAYGNEVYCQLSLHGSSEGVTDGCVFWRRHSAPGTVYEIPGLNAYAGSTGTGFHISGCATDRPGLWVIGKYLGVGAGSWDGQVLVAELVTSGARVYRIAHHHVATSTYFAEPHPTATRNLDRITFASDWEGGTVFEDYDILLPSTAFRVPGLISVTRLTNPSISGTATQGGTLTRTLGTYDGYPTPTVTGRWEISTNSGSSWAAISPAETGATYVIPGGAANGTMYRWGNEIATQTGGGTTSAANSNTVTVAALAAPVNTVAPAIASTSTNSALTLGDTGTWTGNPVPTFSYMWQRNTGSWVDSGLTTINATLTPTGSWRLKVSATNSQGGPIDAFSNTCTVTAVPQHMETTAPTTGGLVSATLAAPADIGDTLLCVVAQIYGANPPRTITSITDSGDAATFTLLRSQVPGSGNIRMDVYRRVVTSAGTRNATVVLSGAGAAAVTLMRYKNAATFGAVNGANGTGTAGTVNATGGSVTPTGTGLVVSCINTTTSYDTLTKASGYTERAKQESGGPSVIISDAIVSGAQNPVTAITAAGAIEWCGVNVTLTP